MPLQSAAGDSETVGPGDTASVDPLAGNVVDIFEAVDLPVILVTTGCAVARFNRAAAATLNLTSQHVGHPLRHIRIFADRPDVQKLCVQIIAGGGSLPA